MILRINISTLFKILLFPIVPVWTAVSISKIELSTSHIKETTLIIAFIFCLLLQGFVVLTVPCGLLSNTHIVSISEPKDVAEGEKIEVIINKTSVWEFLPWSYSVDEKYIRWSKNDKIMWINCENLKITSRDNYFEILYQEKIEKALIENKIKMIMD